MGTVRRSFEAPTTRLQATRFTLLRGRLNRGAGEGGIVDIFGPDQVLQPTGAAILAPRGILTQHAAPAVELCRSAAHARIGNWSLPCRGDK
jgi:hypothetical protein